MQWVVGIDEAGRGALAGPVSVGAVLVPRDFDWTCIPGVADSKILTPKKREIIYRMTDALAAESSLSYAVALISERIIDERGITYAVKKGIERVLRELSPDASTTFIKLDGLLKAPAQFVYQQTIIGGDGSEKEIGLASIMAKVTRDRYMVRAGKRYPTYGFEVHKGYGTEKHRDMIRTAGLLRIHRTTYCAACQVPRTV